MGHSKFQVTGMTEGSYGFEIFHYGIILGAQIWQVLRDLLDFHDDL